MFEFVMHYLRIRIQYSIDFRFCSSKYNSNKIVNAALWESVRGKPSFRARGLPHFNI